MGYTGLQTLPHQQHIKLFRIANPKKLVAMN